MEPDLKIQQYLLLVKNARGLQTAQVILQAAAEPGLFAFGELLDHPAVRELEAGDLAAHVDLLKLFAYGTWPEYKAAATASTRPLPSITQQHELKLKQLTVASMATQSKVIPYSELKQKLDISEVRDLEDFLITECFYSGIIKGSLDQKAGCLYVNTFTSRDVQPSQLKDVIASLQNWANTSNNLLTTIEERMQQAATATELVKQHRETLESKIEEVKRQAQKSSDMVDARAVADSMALDETYDMMEEERSIARPKRRR